MSEDRAKARENAAMKLRTCATNYASKVLGGDHEELRAAVSALETAAILYSIEAETRSHRDPLERIADLLEGSVSRYGVLQVVPLKEES